MNKIKHFLQLIRWFHVVLAILPFSGLFWVIYHYQVQEGIACELSGTKFLLICFCVQLLIAAGCVLNDIADHSIDAVNKPNTRIVGRVISMKKAHILFWILTLLIILLSIYIAVSIIWQWALIAPIVYIFSILYNLYLKRTPLIGNIVMALLASAIPLILPLFAADCLREIGNPRICTLIWLYAGWCFLIVVPREVSLDISDMNGDTHSNFRTLPLVIGSLRTRRFIICWLLIVVGLLIITLLLYQYLIGIIPLLLAGILYYIILLQRCIERIDYIRAGRFLWFIMITGLFGFTLLTVY